MKIWRIKIRCGSKTFTVDVAEREIVAAIKQARGIVAGIISFGAEGLCELRDNCPQVVSAWVK